MKFIIEEIVSLEKIKWQVECLKKKSEVKTVFSETEFKQEQVPEVSRLSCTIQGFSECLSGCNIWFQLWF